MGPKLWKLLSQALGETVSKTTIQAALERQWRRNQNAAPGNGRAEQNQRAVSSLTDWGEAIDASIFYGRTPELETLMQWIVQEHCRLVTLLGMGGIGKSSLARWDNSRQWQS